MIEIKHRSSGMVLYTAEGASDVKTALEVAVLSYAVLRYADLRSAVLRSAVLSYAVLRYADLSYADLSYADLSYADLSSADLSYAKGNRATRLPAGWKVGDNGLIVRMEPAEAATRTEEK